MVRGRRKTDGFWSIEARPWAVISLIFAFACGSLRLGWTWREQDLAQGQRIALLEQRITMLDNCHAP